ncbi:MAG TPA: hypothetical protein VK449_10950, partial [Anaerolineales bacterium]|nr:hypothetical protein [Anaerolineales bacterium]
SAATNETFAFLNMMPLPFGKITNDDATTQHPLESTPAPVSRFTSGPSAPEESHLSFAKRAWLPSLWWFVTRDTLNSSP